MKGKMHVDNALCGGLLPFDAADKDLGPRFAKRSELGEGTFLKFYDDFNRFSSTLG
jgi:hypothetical protein